MVADLFFSPEECTLTHVRVSPWLVGRKVGRGTHDGACCSLPPTEGKGGCYGSEWKMVMLRCWLIEKDWGQHDVAVVTWEGETQHAHLFVFFLVLGPCRRMGVAFLAVCAGWVFRSSATLHIHLSVRFFFHVECRLELHFSSYMQLSYVSTVLS